MPSAAASASVLSWRNVSVPLLNQLIWPGAVNAAVLMKSKSWSLGCVSSASMLVKWSTSLRCAVVGDNVRAGQADLADGRPQEPIAAAVAAQRIDAQAADEDVDAVVAGEEVVELVAGQIDRGRRGGRVGIQHLDFGPGREAVAHGGLQPVEAFADRLGHHVAGIVDDEDVIALAAPHAVGIVTAVDDVGAAGALDRVDAAASVQQVVVVAAPDRVVPVIAGAVETADADQRQVFDFGTERVADRGIDRVGASAGIFRHHVGRVVDNVDVIAGSAPHAVAIVTAIELVVAAITLERVVT